jgi:16S rRNA (uracil1498-N3)-methyltransferase
MRLYVEDITDEQTLTLDKERSHYLCRVRRAQAGSRVELFNGSGSVVHAEILEADKRATRLAVVERREVPAPDVQLLLLLSLIKGDAADRAVQKSVELGATGIRILTSERSNVQHTNKRLEHLRRVAISASEQCGQNHVPGVLSCADLGQALTGTGVLQVLCLQPGQPALPNVLPRRDTLLAIGPEGGWTESELGIFDRGGAELFSLGDLILRAETAPLAGLAAVRSAWGWR